MEELEATHPARKIASVWNELSVEETDKGELAVLEGTRLLVPRAARKELIKEAHSTHMGVDAMMRTVKTSWFWPNMRKQLSDKEASCSSCQEHKQSKPRTPPVTPESIMDLEPMERLSIDVFHWEGRKYLAMADRASTFRWMEEIKRETTEEITACLTK